jgi:eukaryotic-like serine/threonine-protein kinase
MCGTPQNRPSGDPLIGEVVADRYLLLQRLGQGGSGTIYLAEHVTLRRRVAVKVLHHELSRDDLAIERFRREATTVGEIDNDHIVEVFDFGRLKDGRLFLSMELLDGETLHAAIQAQGKLAIPVVADTLLQIGEALMEAHALGYVHRDLRPANVFLHRRRGKPFVKLLDFGLAKLVERDSDGQAAATGLAMTFGDPRYMSPEQARGEPVDRRADIYSLGIIAYEMLTGRPPFTGQKVFDVLTQHLETSPSPPSSLRPEIPPWLDAIVLRMLAKPVGQRFVTVYRMVEALRDGTESGKVMPAEAATTMPPNEVELPRRRVQAGEPTPTPPAPAPAAAPAPAPAAAPAAAVKSPLTASQPVSMPNADAGERSGAWFSEGEAASASSSMSSMPRPARRFSPSFSGEVEYAAPDRRWMLKLAGGVLGAVVVGIVAMIIWGGGGDSSPVATTAPDAAPLATVQPAAAVPDAAPVAVAARPDAAPVAIAPPPDAAVVATVPKPPRPTRPPREPKDPPSEPTFDLSPRVPEPAVSDENVAQASFFVKLGRKALAEGNHAAAVESFNKARAADSRNADAIAGLGEVALAQSRFDEAVVHLEAAARLSSRSARLHYLRGKALLGANRKTDAALAFKRVLSIDPGNTAAADGYREATGKDPP